MEKYRGTGLLSVKKMILRQRPDLQETFLAKLGPEERQLYEAVLATEWLPIKVVATLFYKAAGALYPGNLRGLEELGRQQALDNLQGIYRPMLRVLTINFAIQQVAKLWRGYFDEGEAAAWQEEGQKRAVMSVDNFPGLPEGNRRVISGYIQGVVELCGARNVVVQHDQSRAEKWVWTVTWS